MSSCHGPLMDSSGVYFMIPHFVYSIEWVYIHMDSSIGFHIKAHGMDCILV